MRYSSFNWASGIWAANPKRGWMFGPFWGRTLTVTWQRQMKQPENTSTITVGDLPMPTVGKLQRIYQQFSQSGQ